MASSKSVNEVCGLIKKCTMHHEISVILILMALYSKLHKFVGTNIKLIQIPYSRLFSLDANFSEFPEWAYNLEKFMLNCSITLNLSMS